MLRRLPRSTLFPYTTLFRSAGQHQRVLARRPAARLQGGQPAGADRPGHAGHGGRVHLGRRPVLADRDRAPEDRPARRFAGLDRKSTRLNSSHVRISYAVFCLNAPSPPALYTLSLHDALPICWPTPTCTGTAAGCSPPRRTARRCRSTRTRWTRWASSPGAATCPRRPRPRTRRSTRATVRWSRSEEHTSELQSRPHLVCRLLLECSVASRALHSFPTRRSSDLLANTNVYWHGGRLLASKEDSPPVQIDPDTLDTVGEFTWGGDLSSQTATAHPKIDPRDGSLV